MYSISKESELSVKEAIKNTKNELAKVGFGIIMEIDVQNTLKSKISAEIEEYTILGACNPPSAFEAIKAEKEIGLMLPCNVIVYVSDGKTNIAAIRPVRALGIIGNSSLKALSFDIEKKLTAAIEMV